MKKHIPSKTENIYKKKERNRWATKQTQHGNANVFCSFFLKKKSLPFFENRDKKSRQRKRGNRGGRGRGGCLEGEVETG